MASLLAHALALNQHHSGHILDKGIAEIITLARVEAAQLLQTLSGNQVESGMDLSRGTWHWS